MPAIERDHDEAPPRDVLSRSVQVLQAFTADHTRLTFTEVVDRTSLSKATAHRLLGGLVRAGLLDHEDGRYRLSLLVFELGMRSAAERGLLEVAAPFLEDLYRRTQEAVHLGVRDGRDVVYVAKLGGSRGGRAPSTVGGRLPLHATAIGKALLAFSPPDVMRDVVGAGLDRQGPRTITRPAIMDQQLAAIRERGVAFEFEESAVGVACVAAPVFGADGRLVGAVSIAGRLPTFQPERHAHAVRGAAAGISALLARGQDHA